MDAFRASKDPFIALAVRLDDVATRLEERRKEVELVGLNFDSTCESITKDWYFDTAITRAIHVDIRYMLWVMKEVDGADKLLKEMTIKYPQK